MAPAIELKAIDKSFGPVHANKAIDLTVERGTIHGIIGENGAGKSTLMSILYGFYEADSGDIFVDGEKRSIRSSQNAIAAGIGMVHQHFMLVDPFTVLENVMLGAESGGLLAKGAAHARSELERLEREYRLEVDPDAIVGELAVGSQQRVEILKALYRGAEILILDEPTGVLTPSEADQLFAILKVLKAQGKTVLFITHKLREIMAITDRVSVMRRGEMVATLDTRATSPAELAELMVGRRVLLRVEKTPAKPGRPVLAIENLTVRDEKDVARVDGVSFEIRAGEIVGIAGVAGNGQSELLEAIAGIRKPAGGRIAIDGSDVSILDPADMRGLGLAHVPEDRLRMGLVKAFPAYESAILGYHGDKRYGRGPFLDQGLMIGDLTAKMRTYDVRPPQPKLKTANFSGGNAQKIVLAREIERDPELLLVGQPTRGVDIGAIEFIHRQLIAMRDKGKAILLVSVELEEIMALSDRILVMCGGRLTGERQGGEAGEQELGLLMAGVTEQAA
jgi:ABC-type uncharacterized transport system ATPase subunit